MEEITYKMLKDNLNLLQNEDKNPKYAKDLIHIQEIIKKYPSNKIEDYNEVLLKICYIDMIAGTNLIRNLGKKGGLYTLADAIIDSDFDKRIIKYDYRLLIDIANKLKGDEDIDKNLFSFISKYCVYHNCYAYNRDDYAIVDNVLCDNLKRFISQEEYEILCEPDEENKRLSSKAFYRMKDNIGDDKGIIKGNNYNTYVKVINKILENAKKDAKIDQPKRALDLYIWNKYKPKKQDE